MKRYKFFLILPGKRTKGVKINITAADSVDAYKKVTKDYPNWMVSMFWEEIH